MLIFAQPMGAGMKELIDHYCEPDYKTYSLFQFNSISFIKFQPSHSYLVMDKC